MPNIELPTPNVTQEGWGVILNDAVSAVNAQVDTNTAAIAQKADDSATVHRSGAETIAGVKTFSSQPVFSAGLLAVATTIATDTTTGLKIGAATTQRLGFFNATPIAQPGATVDLGTVLSSLGLRAAGSSYTLSTSGSVTLSGATVIRRGYVTTAITANTTLATNTGEMNDVNANSAAITITPPATTSAGFVYQVTKIDSSANAVTLAGTFNGVSNPTLTAQWNFMRFVTTNVSGQYRVIGTH